MLQLHNTIVDGTAAVALITNETVNPDTAVLNLSELEIIHNIWNRNYTEVYKITVNEPKTSSC